MSCFSSLCFGSLVSLIDVLKRNDCGCLLKIARLRSYFSLNRSEAFLVYYVWPLSSWPCSNALNFLPRFLGNLILMVGQSLTLCDNSW